MTHEDDWFPNPLDSMPIATDKGYITDEYAPCDVEYDLENPDLFIKKISKLMNDRKLMYENDKIDWW